MNGEATQCGRILIILSWVLVIITMPLSLFVCFKVRRVIQYIYVIIDISKYTHAMCP